MTRNYFNTRVPHTYTYTILRKHARIARTHCTHDISITRVTRDLPTVFNTRRKKIQYLSMCHIVLPVQPGFDVANSLSLSLSLVLIDYLDCQSANISRLSVASCTVLYLSMYISCCVNILHSVTW